MRTAILLVAALSFTSGAHATTIALVTLSDMERTSTVVFVGELVAGQGADVGGFQGRRYGFRVERFLRGGPASFVHLSTVELPGISLGLEAGKRYLVFAERRLLGKAETRLTMTGYHQGVYRMVGDLAAANDMNGRVIIDRLAGRLRDATVRVALVHEVDRSKSRYIEGAVYVVRLERHGRVVATELGYLEDPASARYQVRPGWYVVASGAHPCSPDGLCRSVGPQSKPWVDSCRKPLRLTGANATIRIVAQAGASCRIKMD